MQRTKPRVNSVNGFLLRFHFLIEVFTTSCNIFNRLLRKLKFKLTGEDVGDCDEIDVGVGDVVGCHRIERGGAEARRERPQGEGSEV